MQLTVDLSDDDVPTLDSYARTHGLPSRSAALHHAVRALSEDALVAAYLAAFIEWQERGEGEARDGLTGDGLGPPR